MSARVPGITQVRPGVAVSIILKQDQLTGRQVEGVISDVLTRGNHPRGIKVRLQDGRIGRVQKTMVGEVQSLDASTLQKDLQEQLIARGGNGGASRQYRSERLGVRYTDVRNEDGGDEPPAEIDLMAYVKQAKLRKGKGKKAAQPQMQLAAEDEDVMSLPENSVPNAPSVTCPVCNEFEGDEAAVANHVDSHFK